MGGDRAARASLMRMTLSGLHILLTYRCTYECDHCFVWSGPGQSATLTVDRLDELLRQARDLGTVTWIYFEGGEPFLYSGLLRWGARRAAAMGFRVGIVSNAYWATSERDAMEWLRDLTGLVQDLSLSCDDYHGGPEQRLQVEVATAASRKLGIPVDAIRVASPMDVHAVKRVGQLPAGQSALMFRGRAAVRLASRVPHEPWERYTTCPFEDLREPGRIHVDPLGHVHVCQGISIGNVFDTPLRTICETYRPDSHPIVGPLLSGGPAELARRHGASPENGYADACHLCTMTRLALRDRFPECLAPDAIYGESRTAND